MTNYSRGGDLVKERPIIMSTEMVRAILEGRKTMTRRVLRGQPLDILPMNNPHEDGWIALTERNPNHGKIIKCRYGQVGDRLWVRERALYWSGGAGGTSDVVYTDDSEIPELLEDNNRLLMARETTNIVAGENVVGKWQWRPSIFMPRWASRITREITDVRAERLQEITEEEAKAEGMSILEERYQIETSLLPVFYIPIFKWYWDSLNAKRGYGWDKNLWVWVIEFKRLSDE